MNPTTGHEHHHGSTVHGHEEQQRKHDEDEAEANRQELSFVLDCTGANSAAAVGGSDMLSLPPPQPPLPRGDTVLQYHENTSSSAISSSSSSGATAGSLPPPPPPYQPIAQQQQQSINTSTDAFGFSLPPQQQYQSHHQHPSSSHQLAFGPSRPLQIAQPILPRDDDDSSFLHNTIAKEGNAMLTQAQILVAELQRCAEAFIAQYVAGTFNQHHQQGEMGVLGAGRSNPIADPSTTTTTTEPPGCSVGDRVFPINNSTTLQQQQAQHQLASSINQNRNNNSNPCCWVRMCPFGSIGLGAPLAHSDLDMMFLAHISLRLEHFLSYFPLFLKDWLSLEAVPVIIDATRVPLIKFYVKYTTTTQTSGDEATTEGGNHDGAWSERDWNSGVTTTTTNTIRVDVVFVSLAKDTVPTDADLLSNSIFLRVSKDTRQSLNGFRTVLEIKRRLPEIHLQKGVYVTVLQAVKLWAAKRGVYGNLYSFPPGVAVAVMVARVCQLLPSEHASVVFRFFFKFYSQWLLKPGAIRPLYITEVLVPQYSPISGMHFTWNPDRQPCAEEILPVLNPAFPHSNTCFPVGRCGLYWFHHELVRARNLLEQQQGGNGLKTLMDVQNSLWGAYNMFERRQNPNDDVDSKNNNSDSNNNHNNRSTTTTDCGDDGKDQKKNINEDEEVVMDHFLCVGVSVKRDRQQQHQQHNDKKNSSPRGSTNADLELEALFNAAARASSSSNSLKHEGNDGHTAKPSDDDDNDDSEDGSLPIDDDTVAAFGRWSGFVESRLRLLIYSLEFSLGEKRVRPFPKRIVKREHRSCTFIIGLKLVVDDDDGVLPATVEAPNSSSSATTQHAVTEGGPSSSSPTRITTSQQRRRQVLDRRRALLEAVKASIDDFRFALSPDAQKGPVSFIQDPHVMQGPEIVVLSKAGLLRRMPQLASPSVIASCSGGGEETTVIGGDRRHRGITTDHEEEREEENLLDQLSEIPSPTTPSLSTKANNHHHDVLDDNEEDEEAKNARELQSILASNIMYRADEGVADDAEEKEAMRKRPRPADNDAGGDATVQEYQQQQQQEHLQGADPFGYAAARRRRKERKRQAKLLRQQEQQQQQHRENGGGQEEAGQQQQQGGGDGGGGDRLVLSDYMRQKAIVEILKGERL